MSKIDRTLPKGKWQFDEDVTNVFDNMLERSIPEYKTMRALVGDLVYYYSDHATTIIDIGCSNGTGIADMKERNTNNCDYVGYEISKPMVDVAREKFANTKNSFMADIDERFKNVRIYEQDIVKQGFIGHENVRVITSVLTLMFIPIEHRQKVIADCYKELPNGGAFIVVEKILGETTQLNDIYNAQYYDFKKWNGYTEEQIDRKKLALEGVLVPLTSKFNEQLLLSAGFSYVDCFWRWNNFAGWVAIK